MSTGVNSALDRGLLGRLRQVSVIIRNKQVLGNNSYMMGRHWNSRHGPVATLMMIALVGCGSVPSRPARPSKSSYGCMSTVLANKVAADLPDSHAHCLAAGLIARYCSLSEAYLAGAGKELRDLLGPGDAEWRDWQADRVGIACAKSSADDLNLASCCSAKGY